MIKSQQQLRAEAEQEAQEFADFIADEEEGSSGIRKSPQVSVSEINLDTEPFNLGLDSKSSAESFGGGPGGGGPPGPHCCPSAVLLCDQISTGKSKCGFPGFESIGFYRSKSYHSVESVDLSGSGGPVGGNDFTNTWDYAAFGDPVECIEPISGHPFGTSASGTSHFTQASHCSCNKTMSPGGWSFDACTDPPAGGATCFYLYDSEGLGWCCFPVLTGDNTTQSGTCSCSGGSHTFTETLSSEYTTAMLISNTEDSLPAYDDDWADACEAKRELSEDESGYSIQRFRYKFSFGSPLATACTVCWREILYDLDYNPISSEEFCEAVLVGAVETSIHEVIEPGANGRVGINYPCDPPCIGCS